MFGLSWFQILWLWPVWFVLFYGLVYVLEYIHDHWMFGTGADDHRAYVKFSEDCGVRGLNFSQMSDEWAVRTAMAALRRTASDAVRKNPKEWKKELDAAVEIVGKELHATRPDLVPMFAGSIKDLDYSHILYEHETKLVDRQTPDLIRDIERRGNNTPDMIAALRTAR